MKLTGYTITKNISATVVADSMQSHQNKLGMKINLYVQGMQMRIPWMSPTILVKIQV